MKLLRTTLILSLNFLMLNLCLEAGPCTRNKEFKKYFDEERLQDIQEFLSQTDIYPNLIYPPVNHSTLEELKSELTTNPSYTPPGQPESLEELFRKEKSQIDTNLENSCNDHKYVRATKKIMGRVNKNEPSYNENWYYFQLGALLDKYRHLSMILRAHSICEDAIKQEQPKEEIANEPSNGSPTLTKNKGMIHKAAKMMRSFSNSSKETKEETREEPKTCWQQAQELLNDTKAYQYFYFDTSSISKMSPSTIIKSVSYKDTYLPTEYNTLFEKVFECSGHQNQKIKIDEDTFVLITQGQLYREIARFSTQLKLQEDHQNALSKLFFGLMNINKKKGMPTPEIIKAAAIQYIKETDELWTLPKLELTDSTDTPEKKRQRDQERQAKIRKMAEDICRQHELEDWQEIPLQQMLKKLGLYYWALGISEQEFLEQAQAAGVDTRSCLERLSESPTTSPSKKRKREQF